MRTQSFRGENGGYEGRRKVSGVRGECTERRFGGSENPCYGLNQFLRLIFLLGLSLI